MGGGMLGGEEGGTGGTLLLQIQSIYRGHFAFTRRLIFSSGGAETSSLIVELLMYVGKGDEKSPSITEDVCPRNITADTRMQ